MIHLVFLTADGVPEADSLDKHLENLAQGDSSALTPLYNETKTAVFAYALSILKNSQDAEDVMHDLYLTVYHSAVKYKSEGKPMAWIMTITKNLSLRRLRDRKHDADIPEEDYLPFIAQTEGLSPDERLILEEGLSSLSDTERQIVILHAVSGFKHKEIAQFTDLPLSTVLSKYSRAIAKLKKFYKEGAQ